MAERKERCETCKWWVRIQMVPSDPESDGECHGNAPAPSYIPIPEQPLTWPETPKDEFCGKWTPKKKIQKNP